MERSIEFILPCSSSSPPSSSVTPDSSDDSAHYYSPDGCDGDLRHLIRLETQIQEERDTISVLTYNVLADMLVGSVRRYCSSSIIKWESRRFVLLKEIVGYDADVLCLHETQSDHIHKFWVPELGKQGYHHFHAVKKFSRSFSKEYYDNYSSDGCSMFYRRSKMKLVHSYKNNLWKTGQLLSTKLTSASYEDRICLMKDNLAIAGVFELQGSGTRFCVCTCQIHPNPKNPQVKLMQVSEIVRGLKRLHKLKLPIILCGDFNTTPNEPPYRYLVDSHLDWFPQLDNPSEVYRYLDLTHDLELSSAYRELVESDTDDDKVLKQRTLMNPITHEPKFTTCVPPTSYKPEFINTIDYLFYQKRYMTVAALLELVDLKAGEYLPSDIYPSDHIALMAEFTFVPRHLSAEKWLDLPDYIWGRLADLESDD